VKIWSSASTPQESHLVGLTITSEASSNIIFVFVCGCSLVPNPDHAALGLPAGEEDEANLEEALEQLMDDMVMPPVGKAPEDM
jgi:hypothetical protein